jgi:hypothetical protein
MTNPADFHEEEEFDEGIDPTFAPWRTTHRGASTVLAILALIHLGFTPAATDLSSPDAIWFAGTGLGLLLLAVMNYAHLGLGPCDMPTAPVVRVANLVFLALAVWALAIVGELPAVIGVAALGMMTVCGQVTLRGRRPPAGR